MTAREIFKWESYPVIHTAKNLEGDATSYDVKYVFFSSVFQYQITFDRDPSSHYDNTSEVFKMAIAQVLKAPTHHKK